ncbi:MAG: damage-indicible protein DnaD [Cyanobacteria bacterium RYN_339]|nr:damage-indicible protein DnaD [Cyanobacteria bacterium RYN_339]
MERLRVTSPATADLVLAEGAIFLDGEKDRVVFELPEVDVAYAHDTPEVVWALAGAVRTVLGPRFGAFLRDFDGEEQATVLAYHGEDDVPTYEEEVPPVKDEPQSPVLDDQHQYRARSPFERIRRISEDGSEYWSSRDLATVLGYDSYRNFEKAVVKAKDACENSGHAVQDHFLSTTEPVALGKGATRNVDVVYLSRYACYLAIQNADPRKPMVALGQTYFTVQTRRQEMADVEQEDSLRLKLREEIKLHNKQLAAAAYTVGVRTPSDYAIFQDHGYKGLYSGLGVGQIKESRGLKRTQDLLDFMGSTELAANLFRATQTEELLRRGNIQSKDQANRTHHEVGVRVRQAMREISGIMPEDLPVAENIKKVERRLRKRAETSELGEESGS